MDADAVIRYAGPSVERVLGYAPEEMVGRSAFRLVHPDDVRMLRGMFGLGIKQPGASAVAEYRVQHKDGSWRILETVGRNLLHDPAVGVVVLNTRDVTERRRADQTIERQRESLARAEKLTAMGELLAGVGHELNNPLSVVAEQAALLGQTAPTSAVAARAEKIVRNVERCVRIVKNFLDLARQRPPEREAVALNDIVRGAAELIVYQLRRTGCPICGLMPISSTSSSST